MKKENGNAFIIYLTVALGLARTGIAGESPVAAPSDIHILPDNEAIEIDLEPPVIPVGLDAYRQWQQWPIQRLGVRAYMRSTYDRRGGNEGADASHFLYQEADDFNVALDVAGPGVVYFVRCNHWHGSPWHYEVDGTDHVVQETGTSDPVNAKTRFTRTVFIPEELFPNPLTWTWSITKGADLNWVPMPFERTFRLAYSRTRYGTGYYIYHLYDRSARLSQPIRSWDGRTPPSADVLALIARAGTDIAPALDSPEGKVLGVREMSGTITTAPDQSVPFVTLSPGSAMIRAVQLSVSREQAIEFGRARLRVTWDDRLSPSIDAPVALFFGAGTLYNRDHREHLVKAFPMNIRFDAERVHLDCFFPMPFFERARFELLAGTSAISNVTWSIRYHPMTAPREHVGYFHGTYRNHPTSEPGQDLVLLDTLETEGGGDWSGSFVGTSWVFSHRAVLNTLEGDPRFFFDGSQSPQAYGTGTEEWGGGGDYWGGRNMTLPFAGHPCGAPNEKEALCEEDKIESAYRFLLADLMPFGQRAVIRLEHGGENQSTEHYESVTYWYGAPGATLVKTDSLKVGDLESEHLHEYESPEASEPYAITSRYEWGVDMIRRPGPSSNPPVSSGEARSGGEPASSESQVVYAPHTQVGRKTTGSSEFTLRLAPDNWGVVLRRTLDYALPNQRAEVSVSDMTGRPPAWKRAGTWYLAGANTCVYSNPRDELGATLHTIQTSNRRFRDDEFIIPRELTRNRDRIRIRIQFVPVDRPLFPGHPWPELGWSEIQYETLCWVMPTGQRR